MSDGKMAAKVDGVNVDRRKFLHWGVLAGGVVGAGFVGKAFGSLCGITPAQTEGPFYPEPGISRANDLTVVRGSAGRAKGQIVYIEGRVLDADCRPVEGVDVEIWQACESGKYNHSRDPNRAELDPNFGYWGETLTDANGEYQFKTIIPGAYPADGSWMRPPHIHFRVAKVGYRELVTQMYFDGEALNDRDLILQDLSAEERKQVIVDFRPAPSHLEPGSLLGTFEITIQSVRGR